MSRLEIFKSIGSHPYLKKSFLKLKQDDINFCIKFINDFDSFGNDDFESKINRIFMDNDNKPKNFKIICEMLSCTNTIYKTKKGF